MFLGILFGVLSGIILMGFGIVTSVAAKRKLDLAMMQGLGAVILVIACVIILRGNIPLSGENVFLINLLMLIAGVGNFTTFLLIQQAMRMGHNGIIWSLANSALIFPFLMGIIVFHVPPTLPRFTGAALIVAGIILAGFGQGAGSNENREDKTKNKRWFLWALLSLLAAGTTQTVANIPSYLSGIDSFSNIQKGLVMQIGILFISGFYMLFRKKAACSKTISVEEKKKNFRQILWLSLAIAAVNGLTLCVFMFRSFDLLAQAGMGAIGYPIVLGSCISGFFLYSLLFLKEKASPPAVISFFLTIAGIVVIAL